MSEVLTKRNKHYTSLYKDDNHVPIFYLGVTKKLIKYNKNYTLTGSYFGWDEVNKKAKEVKGQFKLYWDIDKSCFIANFAHKDHLGMDTIVEDVLNNTKFLKELRVK